MAGKSELKDRKESSSTSRDVKEQSSERFQSEAEFKWKALEIYVLYMAGDWTSSSMQRMRSKVIPGVVHYLSIALQTHPKAKLISNQDLTQCPHFQTDRVTQHVNYGADVIFEISTMRSDRDELGQQVQCVFDEERPVVIEVCLNEGKLETSDQMFSGVLSLFLKGLGASDGSRLRRHMGTDSYGNDFGHSEMVLRSSKVIFYADTLCQGYPGVPLSDRTEGVEWAARALMYDVMSNTPEGLKYFVSNITLALFEDLGWYKANYSQSSSVIFGANKSHFLTTPCIDEKQRPNFPEFCHTSSELTCDFLSLHKGVCRPVPFLNGCPAVVDTTNTGNCQDPMTVSLNFEYEEEACPECRCLMQSLDPSSSATAACHRVMCTDIAAVKVGNYWIDCPLEGGKVTLPDEQGQIQCPSYDRVCGDFGCPAFCSGYGKCRKGKCECEEGRFGHDCSLTQPPTPCSAGYFSDAVSNECMKCSSNCLTCDLTRDNCLSCSSTAHTSLYLKDGVKGAFCECDPGYSFNPSSNECEACDDGCLTCSHNSKKCTTCKDSFVMTSASTCECPETLCYLFELNLCVSCKPTQPHRALLAGFTYPDLSQPEYYSTVATVVPANSYIYYFVRGVDGISFSEFNPTTSTWTNLLWYPWLTAADGWNNQAQYETIRLVTIHNVIYVFGRGTTGVYLASLDTTTNTWTSLPSFNFLTDFQGFNTQAYYETIRMVAAGTSLYITCRGNGQINIASFDTTTQSWTLQPPLVAFTDDTVWTQQVYYNTFKLAATSTQLFLAARDVSGVTLVPYSLTSNTWGTVISTIYMPDTAGWNDISYMTTFSMIAAMNKVFILSRGATAVNIYIYDTSGSTWTQGTSLAAFTDLTGWSAPSLYGTMQLYYGGSTIYLMGRSTTQVAIYAYSCVSDLWSTLVTTTASFTDVQGWSAIQMYSTIRFVLSNNNLHVIGRNLDAVTTGVFSLSGLSWSLLPVVNFPCDPTCKTCNGTTSSSCLSCWSSAALTGSSPNSCLCNGGYYTDPITGVCQACSPTCATCTGATASDCGSCLNHAALSGGAPAACGCSAGYFSNPDARMCQACNPLCCTAGNFPNIGTNSCLGCHTNCAACSGSASNQCTACYPFASLTSPPTSACACNTGYFPNLTVAACQGCDSTCAACSGSAPNKCTLCPANAGLTGTSPSSCACVSDHYLSPVSNSCQPCDLTCATCSGGTFLSCETCKLNAALSGSAPNSCYCLPGSCPLYDSSNCILCNSACLTCAGTITHCVTCFPNAHVSGGTCVCDANAYPSLTAANCLLCDPTCATCMGGAANMCTSCKANASLVGPFPQSCVCNTSFYQSGSSCLPCDSTCLTCASGDASGCLGCKPNASLDGYLPATCSCGLGYLRNASLNNACVKCLVYFTSSDLTASIDSNYMKLIITFKKPVDTQDLQSCYLLFPASVLDLLGYNPICTWSGDFTYLTVVLGTDFTLRDQSISLISDNLGALSGICSNNIQDLSVTVTYAAARALPIAMITAPSAYSKACGSGLQLSGLGSANTRGQSLQYQWLLVLQPSQAVISTFGSYSSDNVQIVVPNGQLIDKSLNVTLLIIDTFGNVGNATKSISLNISNPISVSMDAPNPFQLTPSIGALISSNIQQQCGNGSDTYSYQWKLYQDHGNFSQTSNAFQLWIAPNTLTPGGHYTCTLNVTGTKSQGSTQISVVVLNTPLSIVFDQSSGEHSIDTDLVVNATNSTDPDNRSAVLSFTWSCAESTTLCLNSAMQTMAFTSGPGLRVRAADLRLGAIYQFTLLLQSGSKRDSKSIGITIIKPVNVNVKIPSTNVRVPPLQPYVLYPAINATSNTTYLWTQVSGTSLKIATPLTVAWIKIAAGQIQNGQSYTFSLTLTQNKQTITQTIQITCNFSPTHGSLSVSPNSGLAITDDFTLQAPFWDDPDGTDYPLSYQFGVILSTGTTLTITRALLSYNYVAYFFPGTLTVAVSVCDSLNACSSANTRVSVTAPKQLRQLQTSTSSTLKLLKNAFNAAITGNITSTPSTVIAYAKSVVLLVDNQFFQMMLSAINTYKSSLLNVENSAMQAILSCCVSLVSIPTMMTNVTNVQSVADFIVKIIPTMYTNINDGNLQTSLGMFSNLTLTPDIIQVIYNYTNTLLQYMNLVPAATPVPVSGTQVSVVTATIVAMNSSNLNMVVQGTSITFPDSFLRDMNITVNSTTSLRVFLYTPPGSSTPTVSITLYKSGSVANGNVVSTSSTNTPVSNLSNPVRITAPMSNYSSSNTYTAYYQIPGSDVWSTSGVSLVSINDKFAVIHTSHFSLFKVDIRQIMTIDTPSWPVLEPSPYIGCGKTYTPIILAEGYLAVCLIGIIIIANNYYDSRSTKVTPVSGNLSATKMRNTTGESVRESPKPEEEVLQPPSNNEVPIIDVETESPRDVSSPRLSKPAKNEFSLFALNPVFGLFVSEFKLCHLMLTLSLFMGEETVVGVITRVNTWDVPNSYNPKTWFYFNITVCLMGLAAGQLYSWLCTGLLLLVIDGKLPTKVFCGLMGTIAVMCNAGIVWLTLDMCDDNRLNTWTSESVGVVIAEVVVTSWTCGVAVALVKHAIRTRKQF